MPGGERCQPGLRQAQRLRQQQGSGKKAQLTIKIPQRAGIRHLFPARRQKSAALSRTAAQASPRAHQGKRNGRQQRSRTDVNQKQDTRRLQQAADDDQRSGADIKQRPVAVMAINDATDHGSMSIPVAAGLMFATC